MTAEPSEGRARSKAAAALRRLGHAMMKHEADVDLLERVAAAADRVAGDLESQPLRQRDLVELKRRWIDVEVADGQPMVHFDECFVSGPWNPMGIAVEVHRDGDGVVACTTLGAAFEGAPGRSHGGIVAAIFDDVLGYLLMVHRVPAFTGELTVRYLAPTPIEEPLEFRAWQVGREGRKLRMAAEAICDGQKIATAEGLFIMVEEHRIRG